MTHSEHVLASNESVSTLKLPRLDEPIVLFGMAYDVTRTPDTLTFTGNPVDAATPDTVWGNYLNTYQRDAIKLGDIHPRVAHLFNGTETSRRLIETLTIPTADGLNRFAEEQLHTIGAHTLKYAYVDGEELTSPHIRKAMQADKLLIACGSQFLFHDTIVHSLGGSGVPEQKMNFLQRLADYSAELEPENPEQSKFVSDLIGAAYDSESSRNLVTRSSSPYSPLRGDIVLTRIVNLLGIGIYQNQADHEFANSIAALIKKDFPEAPVAQFAPRINKLVMNSRDLNIWEEEQGKVYYEKLKARLADFNPSFGGKLAASLFRRKRSSV